MDEARITSLINISAAALIFIATTFPLIQKKWSDATTISAKDRIISKTLNLLMICGNLSACMLLYFTFLSKLVLFLFIFSWFMYTSLFIREQSALTRQSIVIYIFHSGIVFLIISLYVSSTILNLVTTLISGNV